MIKIKVFLVTGNKHKAEEAKETLSEFKIEVEQLNEEKIEPENEKTEKIAADNAKRIADKTNKPVIVDDTGVFFEALDNFPGNQPKRWFDKLGYNGLLKKLEGKPKEAYFQCSAAFCEPGKMPVVFTERFYGKISNNVVDLDKDVLPYERIFVCDETGDYLSRMSRDEKNRISHRGKAFRRLGRHLKKIYKAA